MANSGFKEGPLENNVDLLDKFVTKSYLIDVYPQLTGLNNLQMAGLWMCGYNTYYGQLGDNTNISKSSPVQTICGGTNWKYVSANYRTTNAIKTDGTLWSWGYNNYGQLGTNSLTNTSSPIQTIAGGTNWKSVSSFNNHVEAIKTDGTLWGWGFNNSGQLGINSIAYKSSPIQTISGGTNWKSVSTGFYHTAAIKTDNTLWTWGFNGNGMLGDNTNTYRSSPVQTIAGGTNWKFVSCGGYHISAIKTDGTLWSWGRNDYGQLGDDSIIDKSSPVQTIAGGTNWKQISAGYYHTSAIKTDGSLWLCGYNNTGNLGNNSYTNTSSPVQTIAGGTNWKQVSAGFFHTSAIKTDGTLWLWGYNNNGQLGDNTTNSSISPIQTIAGGNNWKAVSTGYFHTAAISEMGDDF